MATEYKKTRALTAEMAELFKNNPAAYRRRLWFETFKFCVADYILLSFFFLYLAFMIDSFTYSDYILHNKSNIFITILLCFLQFFGPLYMIFVMNPVPEGIKIKRKDAPLLFAEIDTICRYFKVPKFNFIFINHKASIDVIQVMTFKNFGLSRNYLSIGLPLMHILSLEEFCAILSYEISRLSEKNGFYNNNVWQLRNIIINNQSIRNNYSAIQPYQQSKLFINHKLVSFSATLMRDMENRLCNNIKDLKWSVLLSRAFSKAAVVDSLLFRCYDKIIKNKLIKYDKVPDNIMTCLISDIKQNYSSAAMKILQKELLKTTDIEDDKPALFERLSSLQINDITSQETLTSLLSQSECSAADELIKDTRINIENCINEKFTLSFKDDWKYLHDTTLQKKELLGDNINNELPEIDLWDKVRIKTELYGYEVVIEEIKVFINKYPNNPDARFAYGVIMLSENNDDGINVINEIITHDSTYNFNGYKIILSYLKSCGRIDEMEPYYVKFKDACEKMEKTKQLLLDKSEDDGADFSDISYFMPHKYSYHELPDISDILRRNKSIYRAYLVQFKKHLKEFPGHHILIIYPKYHYTVLTQEFEDIRIKNMIISSVRLLKYAVISDIKTNPYSFIIDNFEFLIDKMIINSKINDYLIVTMLNNLISAEKSELQKMPEALIYEREK